MPELAVKVLDAADATLIEAAAVESKDGVLTVGAPGYVDKTYSLEERPAVVRLLSEHPAIYLDRPSAAPGDVVGVHLHAPHGAAARLRIGHPLPGDDVISLPSQSATNATVPDVAFVSSGLDWPRFTFSVPEVRSGLWIVELESDGLVAAAPLIVSQPSGAGRSRLLVLASVGTWACYNHWGGRNRYRNDESGTPTTPVSARRKAASQGLAKILPEVPRSMVKRWLGRDRTATSWVAGRLAWTRPWGDHLDLDVAPANPVLNHLAALDNKILAWLDRQGIEYECAADLDLHRNADLAHERAAIMLMGHAEYWSGSMFDRLAEAHEDGTWILNFSGNSIYRQIDVDVDHSVRLTNIVTRLSGRDETRLTGVRYSEAAYGTAAPFTVSRPEHWVFEGTKLGKGDLVGQRCLICNTGEAHHSYDPSRPTNPDRALVGHGAAGFEVDRRPWSRRRKFTRVAQGAGRRSAEMVVREPSGRRGGVFSASSITFGGSLLVDSAISRIAHNVVVRAVSGDQDGRER